MSSLSYLHATAEDSPELISPAAPQPSFDNQIPPALDQPSFEWPAPTARDTQIPIDRANGASALPDRGFLLGRLSNAGPEAAQPFVPRAGVRNPSPRRSFNWHLTVLDSDLCDEPSLVRVIEGGIGTPVSLAHSHCQEVFCAFFSPRRVRPQETGGHVACESALQMPHQHHDGRQL